MKKTISISFALLMAFAAPGLAQDSAAQDTLFADMGGQAGIDRIVDASVDNYLADPRIKEVFEESNMDRVRAQFKVQFCQIAGGPCQYTGHGMAEAHKGLRLTNADFNAVVEDLQGSDLLRRQMPDAEVAAFRFRAVRPSFDLHPLQVSGAPQADGKTVRLWAQDHEGWLTMDATATLR